MHTCILVADNGNIYDLLYRGTLYESPKFAEGEALQKWQAEFRERFAEIPDDIILQIVDAQS